VINRQIFIIAICSCIRPLLLLLQALHQQHVPPALLLARRDARRVLCALAADFANACGPELHTRGGAGPGALAHVPLQQQRQQLQAHLWVIQQTTHG
jgi:hypothetical protein